MSGIVIVTDSTCALTRHEADALDCKVLSMTYIVGGERREERFQGENGNYEALLRADPMVGTESVYRHVFHEAFAAILASGRDVVCITMSRRLSGAHRAALDARAELIRAMPEQHLEDRIVVVDSQTTISGLEYVIRHARAQADRGYTPAEVGASVREFRSCVMLRFAVPDMRALRRSGRLGSTRRSVEGVLGHYPVFCLREGAIETVEVVRGTIAASRVLVQDIPPQIDKAIISCFGNADELAHFALKELKRRCPNASVLINDGGPVLSSRIGVGSLSVGWVDCVSTGTS